MSDTDTMTLNELLSKYGSCCMRLRIAMELELLILNQDMESLGLNALGPYKRSTYSDIDALREEQWELRLAILDRTEQADMGHVVNAMMSSAVEHAEKLRPQV